MNRRGILTAIVGVLAVFSPVFIFILHHGGDNRAPFGSDPNGVKLTLTLVASFVGSFALYSLAARVGKPLGPTEPYFLGE